MARHMLILLEIVGSSPLVNRKELAHTEPATSRKRVVLMSDSMKARVESLSPRQRQVVRLTSLGCTSREIAAILGMSRWTVENHQFLAKERLGVGKAALLTRIAIKYKISPLDDQLTPAEQRRLARVGRSRKRGGKNKKDR